MNLGRAESVNIHPGVVSLDVLEELFIPLELQMRVQATLHQDLIASESDRLANLLEEHVAVENVSFGVIDLPVEGAEVADSRAHVGVVDVAVDVDRFGRAPDEAAGT